MGVAHYNQNVVQLERLGTKCLIQHLGKTKQNKKNTEKMLISIPEITFLKNIITPLALKNETYVINLTPLLI